MLVDMNNKNKKDRKMQPKLGFPTRLFNIEPEYSNDLTHRSLGIISIPKISKHDQYLYSKYYGICMVRTIPFLGENLVTEIFKSETDKACVKPAKGARSAGIFIMDFNSATNFIFNNIHPDSLATIRDDLISIEYEKSVKADVINGGFVITPFIETDQDELRIILFRRSHLCGRQFRDYSNTTFEDRTMNIVEIDSLDEDVQEELSKVKVMMNDFNIPYLSLDFIRDKNNKLHMLEFSGEFNILDGGIHKAVYNRLLKISDAELNGLITDTIEYKK
jgi:hypothetical protein